MSNLIYLHKNKINNKVYVGKTKHIDNPNLRWCNGNGYKKNQDFYDDIIFYGWDNFEHIILETDIDDVNIDKRENYWINYYNSINPNKGYNKTLNNFTSPKTVEKMKNSWKNPKRKQKQSELMTSLNKTIDRKGKNNSMFGVSRKGNNAGMKRKVMCLETQEIFPTLTDASLWCNPNGSNLRSHIAQQIKGERKSCGKHPQTKIPLHWKYVDN